MKRNYIPLGCDQQGRARPAFLDAPQRHTIAPRTAESDADYACAVHGVRDDGRHISDFVLLGFIVLVCALIACDVIPLG